MVDIVSLQGSANQNHNEVPTTSDPRGCLESKSQISRISKDEN